MTERASTFSITLADALTKLNWVTTNDYYPPASLREMKLSALQNEVTGFQVHITSTQDFTLVLDHANWLHPLGFMPRVRLDVRFPSLPDDAVEVFTVGYVEGDDQSLWMETLDQAGWAEVPAGRPQAVYVRLHLPAEQSAGEYSGHITAYTQSGFEEEQVMWQGRVALQVSRVALPPVNKYHFHLNLWQHCTSIARYYQVGLWSNAHFELIDRYFVSLARLGQKAVTVIAAEIPWSGQRCFRDPAYPSYLFEHSVIEVNRTEEGNLSCDFRHLDRLLSLANKHGMDHEIDLFGLLNVWVDEEFGFGKVIPELSDAVRVRVYDERTGKIGYITTASELKAYIRALQDHLQTLGLLERVRVAADEPANLEIFNQSLAFLKETAPGFRYQAAINHYEFIEEAPVEVADFVPVLPLACRQPQRTAALAEVLKNRGGKMLWYVCCWPPIPNTFLHSPLPEARLTGWLTHYLHLDGFLRWAFCLWPGDPWRRVSFRAPVWPAGDMFFVLPGNDGWPVETLRYEALRMAVQDYELLWMAESLLPPDIFSQVNERAFKYILKTRSIADFAKVGEVTPDELYSTDPVDYQHAREVILLALEEQVKA